MKRLRPLETCTDSSPAFDGSEKCEILLVEFANGDIGHMGSHRFTDGKGAETYWRGPGHPLTWRPGQRNA